MSNWGLISRLNRAARYGVVFAVVATVMISTATSWGDDGPSGQSVPVLGLDNDQVPVLARVPLANYLQALQEGISAVQDSILPVLQNQETNRGLIQSSNPLALQTVAVGLSLTGQIGLSSIWSVSVTPRFRLVFTNSKNPIYPAYN